MSHSAGMTTSALRLDVSLPQLAAGEFDAGAYADHLRWIEEQGFSGGWVMEQAIGPTPFLAPLELLAHTAAVSTRLRLGVAVLVTPLHDPVQLAASVTAVDRLSNGRLDLGVAPGGGFRKFGAFGVDPKTFIANFTEGLVLMKQIWSDDERITFHGRFRDLDDLPIQPKPTQRPHPPLWFGGSAEPALARAVRLGDGFLGAGSTPTEQFAQQVPVVRRQLQEQARTGPFPIGKRVYLAVRDDAETARAQAISGLRRIYGSMQRVPLMPVAGTPDQVLAGLRAVRDAGAELIMLNPLGATIAEDRQQLQRLVDDVLPGLHP